MKITLDIPDNELADAVRFTNARSTREAIVTAVVEFNRRRRMATLVKYAGTCEAMMTDDQLKRLHRKV